MTRTATLIASITIVGLSACTAQERQFVDQIINDPAPAVVTVTCDPAISDCIPPSVPVEYNPTPTTVYDPAVGNFDPAICCDATTTTTG